MSVCVGPLRPWLPPAVNSGTVLPATVQNDGPMSVKFLKWDYTSTTALVLAAVYVLGMLSGWTVVAFVRRSLRRVGESRET